MFSLEKSKKITGEQVVNKVRYCSTSIKAALVALLLTLTACSGGSGGSSDSTSEDRDGDSITNSTDNCADVANTDQTDTDNDGLGNACDDDDDNDNVIDTEDAFPLDKTVSLDSDKDGAADQFNDNCDTACQQTSQTQIDAFPNVAGVSVDADNDGKPDAFHDDCNAECQTRVLATLELDGDDDNDGVLDFEDAFPNNPAVSKDSDNDGIADGWNENCDTTCQENANVSIDAFPNTAGISEDTDNDGQPDGFQDGCDAACQQAIVNAGFEIDSNDDNDAFNDNEDNCPLIHNDDQNDLDNDNIGDVCDTNSYAPKLAATTNASVEENANHQTTLFDLNDQHTNSDKDQDGDSIQYEIVGGTGQAFFSINSNGEVQVQDNSALDYETVKQLSLIIQASSQENVNEDGAQTERTAQTQLDIQILDVQEPRAISVTALQNQWPENSDYKQALSLSTVAPAEMPIGSITWSIVSNPQDDSAQFELKTENATTDSVVKTYLTLNKQNFEAPIDHNTDNQYIVTVQATDEDQNTASHILMLTINDVSDIALGALQDINAAANSIIESAIENASTQITLRALDQDSIDTVTYTLHDDGETIQQNGYFKITHDHHIQYTANELPTLNADTTPPLSILVKATSSDGTYSIQAFDITVVEDPTDTDQDGKRDHVDEDKNDPCKPEELPQFDACDTDGDGKNNGEERNQDSDQDEAFDHLESSLADADNDGVPDQFDRYDDRGDHDSDGDGTNNDVDNCPNIANPSQTNTDKDFENGDELGDACDNDDDGDGVNDDQDAFRTDPDETTDTDSDLIGDNADNCPTISNNDQKNTDLALSQEANSEVTADALGDVCDPDNDNDGKPDFETDGVVDNCPYDYNPQQENADGDAYGDVCDLAPNNASEVVVELDRLIEREKINSTMKGNSIYETVGKRNQINNLGDIDNDGYDDLGVWLWHKVSTHPNHQELDEYRTYTYVIFGNQKLPKELTEESLDALNGIRFDSPPITYVEGISNRSAIMPIGDINGDEFQDFAIHESVFWESKRDDPDYISTRKIYLIHGKDQSEWPEKVIKPEDIKNYGLVHINYLKNEINESGVDALISIGDINHDGFDDVITSNKDCNNEYSKGGYILFGSDNTTGNISFKKPETNPNGINITRLTASGTYFRYGCNSVALGKFNVGDQIDDFAFAQPLFESEGITLRGAVSVIYGAEGDWPAELDLDDLAVEQGFRVYGQNAENFREYWLGITITGGYDMNGNGYSELFIGKIAHCDLTDCPEFSDNRFGGFYIVDGGFNATKTEYSIEELSTVYVPTPESYHYGYYYSSLKLIDDANGDQVPDLLIGAPKYHEEPIAPDNEESRLYQGATWLLYGNTSLSFSMDYTSMTAEKGVMIRNNSEEIGTSIGDGLGFQVGDIGDWDQDGLTDWFVAAPTTNNSESTDEWKFDGEGAVYFFNGRDSFYQEVK